LSRYFLTVRPDPTATLFPYTTLFRSHQPVGDRCTADVGEFVFSFAEEDTVTDHGTGRRDWHVLFGHVHGEACYGVDCGVRDQAEDRKSTRLNSSHVSISYAVFCLKK